MEPNSALGKAFAYLQRHWEGLTRFLRFGNAPLDTNAVERALKRAVLHRNYVHLAIMASSCREGTRINTCSRHSCT